MLGQKLGQLLASFAALLSVASASGVGSVPFQTPEDYKDASMSVSEL